MKGLHGLNRISTAEYRSHLRWLLPCQSPWAMQDFTEKVECRAGSSAAAPQVTLACPWVESCCDRGSCCDGSWLVEVKEQRLMHLVPS